MTSFSNCFIVIYEFLFKPGGCFPQIILIANCKYGMKKIIRVEINKFLNKLKNAGCDINVIKKNKQKKKN